MTVGSETAFLVPTISLAFMDASAEDIMGGVLLRMNINDISTLALNQHTYKIDSNSGELRVTRNGEPCDAAVFQNTIFSALNHVSIGGSCEDAAGSEILRLQITSRIADEPIEMIFRSLDGRKCAVEINRQTAVWCDLAAVNALLNAAN